MEYRIKETKPIKTSTGTKMSKAVLVDTESLEYPNVTFFSPYTESKVGETITGSLESNDYNGKTGWKFKPETTNTIFKRKATDFTKAIEKKQEGIERSQDRKDESIKIASTMNKAVEIVVAEMKIDGPHLEDSRENRILYWREWLWKHWDDMTGVPFV